MTRLNRERRRCPHRRKHGSVVVGQGDHVQAAGPGGARQWLDGPVRIDLHTHSNASDGTDPPAEVMTRARASS